MHVAATTPDKNALPLCHRDNLNTDQVQGEAVYVREVALKEAPDVSKFTMVTLKAVLAASGKDISGQKAELVRRVSDLLSI